MMTTTLTGLAEFCDAAILLVEDDEFSQMMAITMLRQLGYVNVTTANNGQEAVRACATGVFDLVLMDCQMPLMDGFQATHALRARGLRTPIIAFSASDSPKTRVRCAEAGMDDFLPKPASLGAMREKVTHWLACAQRAGTHAMAASLVANRN